MPAGIVCSWLGFSSSSLFLAVANAAYYAYNFPPVLLLSNQLISALLPYILNRDFHYALLNSIQLLKLDLSAYYLRRSARIWSVDFLSRNFHSS